MYLTEKTCIFFLQLFCITLSLKCFLLTVHVFCYPACSCMSNSRFKLLISSFFVFTHIAPECYADCIHDYFTDVNSCYGQCQNGGTCQVGIFLIYLASLFRHCGLNQLHSFCALYFGTETCISFINHLVYLGTMYCIRPNQHSNNTLIRTQSTLNFCNDLHNLIR